MWFIPSKAFGLPWSSFHLIESVMLTTITKILMIEDNPGDVRLLQEALAEIPELSLEFVHCETLVQAFEYLAKSRSEEHTSELQSHLNLVCRLLLEKKKKLRA